MEEKLATESFQAFHRLKTSSDEYIKEAIIHFRQLEMTKSANLFLKSWRILTSEDQKYSDIWEEFKKGNSTRDCHEISIEQTKRGELRRCIIYDLALACLRNDKAYEDSQGNPTLDVYMCTEAGTGNTITKRLRYDGKEKEIGTDVGAILKLQDPFGAMLQCAHSYIDAACLIAYFGITRLNYRRGWDLEASEQEEFAWRSLIWIYNLTNWHTFWDDHNSKKIGLRTTPYGEYPKFLTEEDGWTKRF
jgi:hypothetical protein